MKQLLVLLFIDGLFVDASTGKQPQSVYVAG